MKRQRGFTMIELLVVIGILVILMVILVYALGGLTDSNREKQTKTLLQNLRGLIAEMEVTVGQNKQPQFMFIGTQKRPWDANNPYDLWQTYVPKPVGTPPPPGPANHYYAIYGDAANKFGRVQSGLPERYDADPILNTSLALELLEAVPANKTMLAGLPADSRMEAPPATSKFVTDSQMAGKPRPAVDGWRNPVIFVPAAGIEVTVLLPDGNVGRKLVRSSDRRPFWASAGPDGMFTDPDGKKNVGEDNIYSFEN